MQFVTGGIASGKRTYVASLGYAEEQVATRLGTNEPVLYGLEELLREGALSEGELDEIYRKDVVVCCEVGQGVVPVDAADRAWRELVGRICAAVAARADTVVRMVCGIPVVLKGPCE